MKIFNKIRKFLGLVDIEDRDEPKSIQKFKDDFRDDFLTHEDHLYFYQWDESRKEYILIKKQDSA